MYTTKANITKATIVLGAMLSSGMLMAQAPANPNPDTQLSGQSAPATQTAPMQGRHHEMNPNKQAHHLAKELGLTKDQVQQIKPILADRDQQIQSLRADQSMAQQDRREKMRAIQQDSKGKIEAVLNDSQKQQFEQMLANRRGHRKGGEAGQTPAPNPGV